MIMIEPIMYLGIGLFAAALAGVVAMPFVHARAVRLTLRRVDAATPVSITQIRADKDHLRAEFSMATRRLETTIEKLRVGTAGQAVQALKTEDAIARLKSDIGDKAAVIVALEAREKSLRDQLRAAEEEISIKTNAMHTAERERTEQAADLAKMTSEYQKYSRLSDQQRLEIIELRSLIEANKARDEILLYVMGRHAIPQGKRPYDQLLSYSLDGVTEN